jgi:GT2 family glycosyltransferase
MPNIETPVDSDDPKISVVVPSLETRSTEGVVEALQNQSLQPSEYEVMIINDSSIGVCQARNYGLEAAGGELVAFTDDDCDPPREWLETALDLFNLDRKLVIIEGPIAGGVEYKGNRLYPTANIAVRTKIAREVGGFSSEFEYWREDTEFGWRMEESGKYAYVESFRMRHPVVGGSSLQWGNEFRLFSQYPERYQSIVLPDTVLEYPNFVLWQLKIWDLKDRLVRFWNK